MQDSIQTAPAQATPQASIPSSAPAPTQAYQSAPAQSAQPSYQIPSAPQPEAPVSYQQTAPAAPEANPWQQAFERLSDSFERDAELPTAGSLLGTDPSGSPYASGGMAGFGSGSVPSGSFRVGAADLNSQATQAYSPTQAPSYSGEQTQPASDEYLASVATKVLKSFSTSEPRRQLYLTGTAALSRTLS